MTTNSPFDLYANYGNGKTRPAGEKPIFQPDDSKNKWSGLGGSNNEKETDNQDCH